MKKQILQGILFFIIPVMLLSILSPGCSTSRQAQTPATPEEIAAAINSNSWLFIARNANPQYGRSRYLTDRYEVRLRNDSLQVNLPYFGRAYAGAGYPGSQPVLDFSSTRFNLDKKEEKQGQWLVMIKPADYSEVQSMTFTLQETGNAQVNILLTNRSAISFTGTIAPQ